MTHATLTLGIVGKYLAKRALRLDKHKIATHKHVIGVTYRLGAKEVPRLLVYEPRHPGGWRIRH